MTSGRLAAATIGPVDVTAACEHEFGTLWTAVSRAGGAVRFRADSPEADIRAAATAVLDDVRAGRDEMLVARAGRAMVGSVLLHRRVGVVVGHGGEVQLLMVHPDRQGAGLGTALLDAAVARARERGLAHLMLATRGGTPLPAFYARRGWTQVGLFPDVLCVGPGDLRDEHWFHLRL